MQHHIQSAIQARMRSKYGPGILAYAIYHNIGLKMSLEGVHESLNRLSASTYRLGAINTLKTNGAKAYQDAYERLLAKIVAGKLIHADETKVSVKGVDGFVWAFASMEEVVYVYAETREGDTLERCLRGFTGVLVSDFYAAVRRYCVRAAEVPDSSDARSQRCGSEASI